MNEYILYVLFRKLERKHPQNGRKHFLDSLADKLDLLITKRNLYA